jgi:hypothetical protein
VYIAVINFCANFYVYKYVCNDVGVVYNVEVYCSPSFQVLIVLLPHQILLKRMTSIDKILRTGLEPATFCFEDRCSAIEPSKQLLMSCQESIKSFIYIVNPTQFLSPIFLVLLFNKHEVQACVPFDSDSTTLFSFYNNCI